jgi:hypothetical protein
MFNSVGFDFRSGAPAGRRLGRVGVSGGGFVTLARIFNRRTMTLQFVFTLGRNFGGALFGAGAAQSFAHRATIVSGVKAGDVDRGVFAVGGVVGGPHVDHGVGRQVAAGRVRFAARARGPRGLLPRAAPGSVSGGRGNELDPPPSHPVYPGG